MSEIYFNAWADDYDQSVLESDEKNSYPFAGYNQVLMSVYKMVMNGGGGEILDIGFGTGVLTQQLYQNGCCIWGVDFSSRMIELAQAKMPDAHLMQGDFSDGIPEELHRSYDFIVATYSLHHLNDEMKVKLIKELLTLLKPGGKMLIGDVAFERYEDMDRCRKKAGDEWDDEEYYMIAKEIIPRLPCTARFEKISLCAGILILDKD